MKKRSLLLPAIGLLILQTSAPAAVVIWGLTATTQSSQGTTPSNTTVTRAQVANVNGTDGDGFGSSGVGLNVFDTEGVGGGNIYIRHAPAAANTTINFSTGYTEFTISANPGYTMDLTNLTWDSARGGTSNTRGFELYGVAGGTPTIGDQLLDVNDETGSRSNPVNRSANLTGAAFQGISSVTFRYYALTSSNGSSIDIANLELNGTVNPIPEPSALALFGLASLGLVTRRRR